MTRIGVTGHRRLSQLSQIIKKVEAALNKIAEVYPGPMSVYSSLAEGADCLVARQTLRRPDARLVVPLPLPEAEYLDNFPTEESRREFLDLLAQADEVIEVPPKATRQESYKAAGEYILFNCDVLIAIWDGKTARGEGGTGQIVAEARRRGLPIARISVMNGDREEAKSGLDDDTLRDVIYENFPTEGSEQI